MIGIGGIECLFYVRRHGAQSVVTARSRVVDRLAGPVLGFGIDAVKNRRSRRFVVRHCENDFGRRFALQTENIGKAVVELVFRRPDYLVAKDERTVALGGIFTAEPRFGIQIHLCQQMLGCPLVETAVPLLFGQFVHALAQFPYDEVIHLFPVARRGHIIFRHVVGLHDRHIPEKRQQVIIIECTHGTNFSQCLLVELQSGLFELMQHPVAAGRNAIPQVAPTSAEMGIGRFPFVIVQPQPDTAVIPASVRIGRNDPGIGSEFGQIPDAAVLVEPAHLPVHGRQQVGRTLFAVVQNLVDCHIAVNIRIEIRA